MKIVENGLIPVYENEGYRLVSGRELHLFLESKRQFADWMKDRIEKYGFIETQDYMAISQNCENGGRRIEYVLKLEPAKEIAMVENNEKGKQIRRYFINVEEKYRNQVIQFQIPQTFADALRLAAEQWETNQKLITTIEEQKPLVLFAESCIASNDSLLVRELAKLATKRGIEIGEKRLWKKLREWEVVNDNNEPYQRAFTAGWFETKQGTYNTPYGSETYRTYKVTPKGQIYIIERLKKELLPVTA